MTIDYEAMLDTKAWGAKANAEIAESLALQEILKTTILDKNATITSLNDTVTAQAAEIAALKAQVPPPKPVLPFTVPSGYALDKYDLFDGTAIDKTKWNIRTGPLNAPREEYNTPNNIVMLNPGMRIVTKREAMGGKSWTSAYVDSAGLMTFGMNSLIVVKARVDDLSTAASGIWPCPLWLRGDWPGEIDAAEMYGWPFLNPARTNATENARMRSNFGATVHSNTAGGTANKKQGRQPANPTDGMLKPDKFYEWGIAIDDAAGITLLFEGKPLVDAWARPNPMSWDYLAGVGIPKSAFTGTGHARIQTQVGDTYWGPSSPGTRSPFHMDIAYFYIAKKV